MSQCSSHLATPQFTVSKPCQIWCHCVHTQSPAAYHEARYSISFWSTSPLHHVRSSLTDDVVRTVACSIVQSRLDYCNALFTGMSEANLSKLQRARQSSPQKGQVRAHHSSTVRTSLAAGSAAYRLQSGHAHLISKTIRTSDLSFTTVMLSDYTSNRSLRSASQHRLQTQPTRTVLAQRGLPLQLQKSGTVYRKISETVVLWKLSDAKLKLTCLTVHFLPRLVSPAPTKRLL